MANDYSLDSLYDSSDYQIDTSLASKNAYIDQKEKAITATQALNNQINGYNQADGVGRQQIAQQQLAAARYNQYYQSTVIQKYANAEIDQLTQLNAYSNNLTAYNNAILKQNANAISNSALESLVGFNKQGDVEVGKAVSQYGNSGVIANTGSAKDVTTNILQNVFQVAHNSYVQQINKLSEVDAQISKNDFAQGMQNLNTNSQKYLIGLRVDQATNNGGVAQNNTNDTYGPSLINSSNSYGNY